MRKLLLSDPYKGKARSKSILTRIDDVLPDIEIKVRNPFRFFLFGQLSMISWESTCGRRVYSCEMTKMIFYDAAALANSTQIVSDCNK